MTTTLRPLAAEIVTTGTEILLGEIVDTNAAWIAGSSRETGLNLYYKTTVGDNEARLTSVLQLGLSRSDVIIVSGGLGPTADDITREAIAAATHRSLSLHDGALATLKARFARFGVEMTDNNRKQALIPNGAELIDNPVGTAPGFIVESQQGTVIALPGVPREMKHLMTESVVPYLRQRSGGSSVIRVRVLRTVGIGESTLDSRLGTLMLSANPTIGLSAHTAQADIRITARAESSAHADAMLDDLQSEICGLVGEHIYSTSPDKPFEAVVASMLHADLATVALLESNSRGDIGRRLISHTVSADLSHIAWQTDDADLPTSVARAMQIDDRSPTEKTAADCAAAVRHESGATYALAVLGTSGEHEGMYGRGSGITWMALAREGGVELAHLSYGGTDEYTVRRIGNQALVLLWRSPETEALALFTQTQTLKNLPRTGWLLAGVSLPESVAEHSYGTALIASFVGELINCDLVQEGLDAPLDLGKVIRIAVLHDLAECMLTDLPKRSTSLLGEGVKHDAERRAMQRILENVCGGKDALALWEEYERLATPEARVVRDADKLDMLIQARSYAQAGHANLDEFWQGHDWQFTVSRRLCRRLRAESDTRYRSSVT